jgi:hypothetical protein
MAEFYVSFPLGFIRISILDLVLDLGFAHSDPAQVPPGGFCAQL